MPTIELLINIAEQKKYFMSHHHNEHETTGVVKNYTLTAFLSFAIMFCLFTLLSQCKGDYKLPTEGHQANKTEHHQSAE